MSTESTGHKLGEVLRAAREERGVDLARVERDTKIRARYLTALETADYRSLPGAVYTKGFLRNYGAYLGLDPDYLIDLYRLESAGTTPERVSVQPPPRPITARRARAFVVTPGAVVAAILTVLVVVFVVYFVNEFLTFARTPTLTITSPASDLPAYTELTYTIEGQTEPNSTLHLQGAVENPTVTADANGAFSVHVELVPGSNVLTLVASDPKTGRDSDPVTRTIVVVAAEASPTPSAGVSISGPDDGASLSGPVTVRGSAAPGARLTVTAVLVAVADPSFEIRNPLNEVVPLPSTPPDAPEPKEVTAGVTGSFNATLDLAPGRWRISVQSDVTGAQPVSRTVDVAAEDGLHGTLRVEGGISYLEIDEDGVGKPGVSGRNAPDGTVVELSATSRLRIRVGNAGAVTLELNGVNLGTMGGSGAVIEWRITQL